MPRIRLREKYPLPCSIDAEGKVTRVTLIPNQWVEVPEVIYTNMKNKNALRSDLTRMVPDYEANRKDPHAKGTEAIMREEVKPGYIMEFQD